jgi:tetratricopeptide (TPR) repeat protein
LKWLDENGNALVITGVLADDPAAGLVVLGVQNGPEPLPINRSVREIEPGLKLVTTEYNGSLEENTVERLLPVPQWVALLQSAQGRVLAPGSPVLNRKGEAIGIGYPFLALGEVGFSIPAAYFPDARGRAPMNLMDWLTVRTPSLVTSEMQMVLRQMVDQPAEALERLRSIIGGGSPYAAHYIHAGILAQQIGDTVSAEGFLRQACEVDPGDHSAWRALGEFFNEQERFDEAMAAFEASYRSGGNNATICFHLASLYTKAGRRDEAIAKLVESLEADPEFMPSVLAYGAVVQNLGRYGEAYAVYKRVVRKYGDIPDLLLHFGVCAHKSGHVREAVEALEACLPLDPENILVPLALTSALLEDGQVERCRQVLNEAQGRFPDDKRIALQFGLVSKAAGQQGDSLQWFQQAQDAGIESPEFFRMLGNDYAVAGDFERAILTLEKAIAQTNADDKFAMAGLYCDLGHAQVGAGRSGDAIESYGKTIDFAPGEPQGYVYLGREFFKAQQWNEATLLLTRARELDPENAEAGMTLGLVLERQERWQEAAAVYETTVPHLPYDADAWFRLAWSHYRGGDRDAAAKTLRKVVKMAAGYGPAHYLLGHVHLEKGRASEALESFKKAAELTPESPDPALQTGRLYMQLGQGRRAAVYFQRAVAIAPERVEALIGLADSLFSVGDVQNARAAVDSLRALAPKEAEHFADRLRNSLN